MEDNLTVVVGGQAGSEGKGAVTARLHRDDRYNWAVRVGGPNAGHTVVDDLGERFPLRQIPVAAVVDPACKLVIAAGSEVDPKVMGDEIELLETHGYPVTDRLYVDQEATLVDSRHAASEAVEIKTGTTGKGIGAARAARAMRRASLTKSLPGPVHSTLCDSQQVLREALDRDEKVMIEGTQGYILGSHAGYYPYCTSGDCRAIDFLAACGLPPVVPEVWMVLRSHPIRIAGESGPIKEETTWEELGLQPEITTVTKKVRRVGMWDWGWAEAAAAANRPDSIALTFADYWWPDLAGEDGHYDREDLPEDVRGILYGIDVKLNSTVRMLGTGPRTQILTEGEGER